MTVGSVWQRKWILTGFVFGFLLTGCEPTPQDRSDQVVVQVGSSFLTAGEFANRLADRVRTVDPITARDPSELQRLKDAVFTEFVYRVLTDKYAKTKNIKVSDKELEARINEIRDDYPDDLTFRDAVSETKDNLASLKKEVRKSLLEQKVVESLGVLQESPPEKELRRIYKEIKDEQFKRKTRLFIHQIVVDQEESAQKLRRSLNLNNFEEMAKQYSIAPEGKLGGVVGWIEEGDYPVFDQVKKARRKKISQPIESPFGFHLVYVEKRERARTLRFEQVRDQLETVWRSKREQELFGKWLENRLKETRVFKDDVLIGAMSLELRNSQ